MCNIPWMEVRHGLNEDVQVELHQKGVFFVKVGKECRKVEL